MRHLRTTLIVIAISSLLWNTGFRFWESLFTNFAVGEIGLVQDSCRGTPAAVEILPTAEAQRTRRDSFLLCVLCVSAVGRTRPEDRVS